MAPTYQRIASRKACDRLRDWRSRISLGLGEKSKFAAFRRRRACERSGGAYLATASMISELVPAIKRMSVQIGAFLNELKA
jgi:hypothetical protein